LIIEAVTRREPSLRVRMWAQQIGFFLMLGLMAFLIINDLLKL
jgi:regulator of sigma E protease